MADTILRKIHVPTQNPVNQKMVDLGDDTYADAVSIQDISASLDTPPITVNGAVTRPNDTNVYAAGDVVSDSTSAPTVLTFSNIVGANGDGGFLLGATLVDSANQASPADLELWVFDTTVTAMEDNAAFDPTDAEVLTCVGVIEFLAANSFVGNSGSGATGNRIYAGEIRGQGVIPFTCGVASRSLFGVLVVRNAYTPVAQEVFTIRLQTGQR